MASKPRKPDSKTPARGQATDPDNTTAKESTLPTGTATDSGSEPAGVAAVGSDLESPVAGEITHPNTPPEPVTPEPAEPVAGKFVNVSEFAGGDMPVGSGAAVDPHFLAAATASGIPYDDVFAARDYGDHYIVVTVDGKKARGDK